jgi:hypothetical protein
LLVGVFNAQRLIAIQRLFLDPVTGQRTHRMMLGNSRGGTWPASFAGDTMRIAEGFETACAYRQLTGAMPAPALACATLLASPLVPASGRSSSCLTTTMRECRPQGLPSLHGNRPISPSALSAARWLQRLGGDDTSTCSHVHGS